MDFRPLGSVPNGDPEILNDCREVMGRCRNRAHEALAGCIGGGKITIWCTQDDGRLTVAAPDWAVKCFDGADGMKAHGLYVTRDDFTDLVRLIAPEESRHYLGENYGDLWREPDAISDRVEPSALRWSHYDAIHHAELSQLAGCAAKDEWWTWPEAIAWLGERSYDNVATLRFWAKSWRGDSDPTIVIAAQAYMAKQYQGPAQDVETELRGALESGAVKSLGRDSVSSPSKPLERVAWRGGSVVYSGGGAQLVSARDRLSVWAFDIAVSRVDLIREFPCDSGAHRSIDSAPLMSDAEIVQWCRDWMQQGRGNGEGPAWDVFKELSNAKGLTRDDCFRPAWRLAKTKHIP